ncbi:Ig-like protein [Leptospira ognonensis]|uniref:Ig-like protein n=1 Tax=Leptospira ognonensis TaxID=2484945 RepID=A0A4R9JZU7_9LEPT|nr:Ig-like domain-containing protein [Leptospira ognonensis]TGL57928.1 Ig-like protein [Leptospira ognonensis]
MQTIRKWVGAAYALIIFSSSFMSCAAFLDEKGKFSLFSESKIQDPIALRNQFLSASVFFRGNGTVTENVGTSGGRVSNGSVAVDVPSGALSSDTQISVSVEEMSESDVPGLTPVAAKIVLSPDGLTFAKPVTLTVKYDAAKVASKVQNELTQIYYYNPATNDWEQQTTTVDIAKGTLTTELNHFSTYGALHINIEKIVSRIITDSSSIRTAATQFRTYLQRFRRTNDRNNFYSLYNQTLLPFLNIVKAEYAPAKDPLLLTFTNDDFDQDGARNSSDTYPYDPSNGNDTIAPTVVSGTPVTNVLPLAPGNNFVVTFNEPVNELTVLYAGFVSKDQNLYAPLKFKSISSDRKTVTYTNEFTLDSDSNYAFYINGVTDEIGNYLAGYRIVTSFHTADVTSPQVVKMEPEGMGLDPAGITQIVVHFNEPMKEAGLELTKLIGFGDPELEYVSLSADKKIATYNIKATTPLRGSAAYGLKVDESLKDLSSNPIAVGGRIYFFGTADNEPPTITNYEPQGNTVAQTTRDLYLTVSEDIDSSNLSSLISVEDETGANVIPITNVSYDSSLRKISIQVAANSFTEKKKYNIKVSAGLKDGIGNATQVASLHPFEIGDTTPPSILSVSPEMEYNLVHFGGLQLKIKFNEAMDRQSLFTNPIVLKNLTDNTELPISLSSYDDYLNEATFYVDGEILGSYKEYNFMTSTSYTDRAGLIVQNSKTGYFTTTADQLIPSNPTVSKSNLVTCNNGYRLRTEFSRKIAFPEEPNYHSVEAKFNYSLSRYTYGYLPGVVGTNRNFCEVRRQDYYKPNPEFISCISILWGNPWGIVCWLLPTTVYAGSYDIAGPCKGYNYSGVTRQTSLDLRTVSYSADAKTSTFSTQLGTSFKVIPTNDNFCQRMDYNTNYAYIGSIKYPVIAPEGYNCNELNTYVWPEITSHSYATDFVDLNNKTFRFSRWNYGYWQAYSQNPKTNECSN